MNNTQKFKKKILLNILSQILYKTYFLYKNLLFTINKIIDIKKIINL